MAHIFFIDPLEKLNIKKDSTLMMALTFQKMGLECFLLFEEDFYVTNDEPASLELYRFDGEFKPDGFYLDRLEKTSSEFRGIAKEDIIHMRIDPPYDSRYQRYLWMLDFLQNKSGCEVMNTPLKIMKYNEKLVAYRDLAHSHESYVGSSHKGFDKFLQRVEKAGYDSVILKPLDLYSGIGVEKVSIKEAGDRFDAKVEEFHGAIVCQPFVKEVQSQGEYRAVYMDGVEIGTILKTPPEGAFLANIAQGAQFKAVDLPPNLKEMCDHVAQDLFKDGARLLAFDVLGNGINEVNITCPGLLVEVSYAYNKNVCELIAHKFKS